MRPVSAHAAALDRDRCDLTIKPSIISLEPIPAFSSQYLLPGRHKARSCTQITGPSPNNHCIKNQLRTFRSQPAPHSLTCEKGLAVKIDRRVGLCQIDRHRRQAVSISGA
jgi:hypothetical protein